MKRIAIIGAGSFLARNFITYCIKNHRNYKFELYDHVERKDFLQFPFKRIDFKDFYSVSTINFDVDSVMIFVGKTGTINGFHDYQQFVEANEILLLNILRAYVESKTNALIIYPSTRLIFKSDEKQKISEDSPHEFKSIYAITKYAAENYLKLYSEIYDFSYVIIRICTPIGTLLKDFGSYGTFEIFKKQALDNKEVTVFGDGKQKKTFTIMSDICKAFSLIIDKGETEYREYNLGGQELQLIDIAKSIASEYHVGIKHIEWPELNKKVDGGSVVFDSSRFDKEFGMNYVKLLVL